MKRVWKNLMLSVLALAMVLGLTLTAQAVTLTTADDGSKVVTSSATVTIENKIAATEKKDITYTAYQIVYATYDAASNSLVYHLTDWAQTALGNTADANTIINSINVGNGATEQNATLNELAASKPKQYYGQWNADSKSNTTVDLPVGVYLITADAAGMSFLNMMVSVDTSATTGTAADEWTLKANGAVLKGREITIDKKVNSKDSATAQIGDKVTFTVTADVPRFPKNATNYTFKIVDTPTNLAIDENSVVVNGDETYQLTKDEDYTVKLEDGILTVDFTDSYMTTFYSEESNTYPYSYVTVEYSATILSSAEVGNDKNKNDVKLVYDQKPYTESDYGIEDSVPVYTYGLELTKLGENNAALAGAEFEVSVGNNVLAFVNATDDNGNAIEGSYKVSDGNSVDTVPLVTVGDNGKLILYGLDAAKTYTIRETKAPAGYSLNGNTLNVVITANGDGENNPTAVIERITAEEKDKDGKTVEDNLTWTQTVDDTNEGLFTVSLTDTKIPQLPATGGIGTTIFTVCGVILMIAALLLLFLGKRKKAEEN